MLCLVDCARSWDGTGNPFWVKGECGDRKADFGERIGKDKRRAAHEEYWGVFLADPDSRCCQTVIQVFLFWGTRERSCL